MTELILHSFRRCPFAIRVRMVLEEKGLEYTLREEDLSTPSSELLRIHPSGQVPVLLHEDLVIPESAIITEYLEEIQPHPTLMPKTAAGRAQVRLWTHWCAQSLKPDLDLFKYEWPQLAQDQQAELLARLRCSLARLKAALESHDYLLGSALTLADIHLFPFYRQLTKARPLEPGLLEFPDVVQRWLQRIVDRPSFTRAMNPRSV